MLETVGYIVLGLVLILVPGFLLSTVLYPKAGSLDLWSRVGMSFGLGIMLVIYEAFVIARLKALMFGPFLTATLITCGILGVLTYLRGGFGVVLTYVRGALRIPQKTIAIIRGVPRKLGPPEIEGPKEVPAPAKPPEAPPEKPPEEIESRVLEYIESHGGEIYLTKCAEELALPVQAIEMAIKGLKEKGKLELASEETQRESPSTSGGHDAP
jgi:hypothetical protein